MSIPGRRRFPRAWLLATLALALTAPGSVFAGGPHSDTGVSSRIARHGPIPVPREQHPGDTAGFRVPFGFGVEAMIGQGWNTTFSHNGKAAYAYDFVVPIGTPVVAAADGVVSYIHDGEVGCGGPDMLMKANIVDIDHADGSATQYAHLSSVGVKVGDVVVAGQEIGKSGDTGYSQCLPHLHFARQYQGGAVTQSVPIYFEGYADQEFHDGEIVTAANRPACAAPKPDGTLTGNLPVGSFCGSYFGGAVDRPATLTRLDGFLNFDWSSHGPGGYWLDDPKVGFSARWSGLFPFPSAGTYTIGVIAAGGVIVTIDGLRVVDRLDAAGATNVVLTNQIGAGVHRVDVEYQSSPGHGLLKVGWGRLLADE